MDAFGITVPKTLVSLKKVDGAPAVEFPLPGFKAERLATTRVEAVGTKRIFFALLFNLPKTNAAPAMAVALKNCI
jgi:hypothetical protein